MVTNGNWASINTNTNTNLPSSVLAASLFYCLVEYPIFLMTAVVSILPGSMPGFGLIARKFPDPNSADLSAQILSQHLWWPPGASHSLTNSIHHPGNPVPSLERVESFSGSLQIKLVGFWKSPFFKTAISQVLEDTGRKWNMFWKAHYEHSQGLQFNIQLIN